MSLKQLSKKDLLNEKINATTKVESRIMKKEACIQSKNHHTVIVVAVGIVQVQLIKTG